MRSIRRRSYVLASVLLLAGLAACGGDDASTATTAGSQPAVTTAPATGSPATTGATGSDVTGAATTAVATTEATDAPTSGGTLTYLRYSEQASSDPAKVLYPNGEANYFQLPAIFDQLLYIDPDTGQPVYRLAESLTSDDAVTWTLTLRSGVQFSDGTPFDAEAVKFNWERIADPATASTQAGVMKNVASVEVVDPLTLRVTLTAANALFPGLVGSSLGFIGSPTAIKANPDGFGEAPVGAGPFILKSWVKGDRMELERNPNYWDAPRPYLDKLVIRTIADDEARFNTLITGDGDVAETGTNPTYNVRAEDEGFTRIDRSPSGGHVFLMNNTVAPFDDIRARQAIQLAIDPEALNQAVFEGNGEVIDSIFKEGTPFHDPTIKWPTPDAAKAQTLIDEYVAEKGTMKFTIMTSTAVAKNAKYIQNLLGQFDGIEVEVEELPASETGARVAKGEFTGFTSGYQISSSGDELVGFFSSGSPTNYARYSNPEVDAALAEARETLAPEDRFDSYSLVQTRVIEDVPVVFYARLNRSTLFQEDQTHGLTFTPAGPVWADVWMSQS